MSTPSPVRIHVRDLPVRAQKLMESCNIEYVTFVVKTKSENLAPQEKVFIELDVFDPKFRTNEKIVLKQTQ